MAQMLAIASCMRGHGVPNFPDPVMTMPPTPPPTPVRYSSVGNQNGVIWAIPKSVDVQSPAVKHAAAACGPGAAAVIGPDAAKAGDRERRARPRDPGEVVRDPGPDRVRTSPSIRTSDARSDHRPAVSNQIQKPEAVPVRRQPSPPDYTGQ